MMDDSKKIGLDALQRIVDLITTDATISVKEGRGRIFFNVNGGKSGVLIGKQGQTLEAIQYLVEKMVNKRSTKRVRVQVDVEGYLQNRRFGLQKRAKQQAEKAKRTGKPATMPRSVGAPGCCRLNLSLASPKGLPWRISQA